MKKAATSMNHKCRETEFLPSDYIMSSLDIADALAEDHREVFELIQEVMNERGPLDNGYVYAVNVKIDGIPTSVFLLDLGAVIQLAEYLSDGDGSDGRALLKRYFDLARSGKVLSVRVFMEVLLDMYESQTAIDSFIKRIKACIERNLSIEQPQSAVSSK